MYGPIIFAHPCSIIYVVRISLSPTTDRSSRHKSRSYAPPQLPTSVRDTPMSRSAARPRPVRRERRRPASAHPSPAGPPVARAERRASPGWTAANALGLKAAWVLAAWVLAAWELGDPQARVLLSGRPRPRKFYLDAQGASHSVTPAGKSGPPGRASPRDRRPRAPPPGLGPGASGPLRLRFYRHVARGRVRDGRIRRRIGAGERTVWNGKGAGEDPPSPRQPSRIVVHRRQRRRRTSDNSVDGKGAREHPLASLINKIDSL